MTLVRWNPNREFNSLQKSWSNMIADVFGSEFNDDLLKSVWVPRVDIMENADSYMVHADLPGLNRDDIDITLDDGILTISGERKSQFDKESETCHLSERIHGKFSRSFNLRNSVNPEQISAKFDDGVLTITLPKVEEAKPKKIEINVN